MIQEDLMWSRRAAVLSRRAAPSRCASESCQHPCGQPQPRRAAWRACLPRSIRRAPVTEHCEREHHNDKLRLAENTRDFSTFFFVFWCFSGPWMWAGKWAWALSELCIFWAIYNLTIGIFFSFSALVHRAQLRAKTHSKRVLRTQSTYPNLTVIL